MSLRDLRSKDSLREKDSGGTHNSSKESRRDKQQVRFQLGTKKLGGNDAGNTPKTMVYVKKSNESPMEISTVDETKEEASVAVTAASNGTSRPTTAAAKTTVAQKQANGQSRNVT